MTYFFSLKSFNSKICQIEKIKTKEEVRWSFFNCSGKRREYSNCYLFHYRTLHRSFNCTLASCKGSSRPPSPLRYRQSSKSIQNSNFEPEQCFFRQKWNKWVGINYFHSFIPPGGINEWKVVFCWWEVVWIMKPSRLKVEQCEGVEQTTLMIS